MVAYLCMCIICYSILSTRATPNTTSLSYIYIYIYIRSSFVKQEEIYQKSWQEALFPRKSIIMDLFHFPEVSQYDLYWPFFPETFLYRWVSVFLLHWLSYLPNSSAREGYDTRSIFKRSLTGFEFRIFLLLD